jgi:hypothetical protein
MSSENHRSKTPWVWPRPCAERGLAAAGTTRRYDEPIRVRHRSNRGRRSQSTVGGGGRPGVAAVAAVLLAAASAGDAPGARAEESLPSDQLDLVWQAPAGCPAGEDVRARVAELLGGTIRLPPARVLAVRARVTAEPTWRVEIASGAGDQARRRELDGDSCAGLANATALIVALMIDPNMATPPPGPRGLSSPPAPPAAAPAEPRPARPGTAFNLGLSGFVEDGILPKLDVGAAASLGLARGAWRFDLQGRWGARRDQVVSAPAPAGAFGTFDYLGGSLGACRIVDLRGLVLGPCGDVGFGLLSAKGHNVTQEIAARAPWLGVELGGYAAVRAGSRVSFPLRAALLVPVTRPEFVIHYDVAQRVYRVAGLGARASLGVELHF